MMIAPEEAGGVRRGLRCDPDDSFSSFGDRARSVLTSHFRPYPARADGMDRDLLLRKRGGELTRDGVERGLGEAVSRARVLHICQRPESAGHIDDAARAGS